MGMHRISYIQALFPLAPAYELSNARHQDIKGCDRLPVVVQTHVEGLDVLGIVVDNSGLLIDILRNVPLMLRCQINTPAHLQYIMRWSLPVALVNKHVWLQPC